MLKHKQKLRKSGGCKNRDSADLSFNNASKYGVGIINNDQCDQKKIAKCL